MSRRSPHRSRALAALLLLLLLVIPACDPATGGAGDADAASKDATTSETREGPAARREATGASVAPETTATEGTTASGAEKPAASPSSTARSTRETAFVHRAAPENVIDNSTYIDDPSVNGDPDAVLLIKRDPEDGVADDEHPIGVWYDRYRDGGRWAIFNQDLDPMADGSAFEVTVFGGGATATRADGASETAAGDQMGEVAFVHRATPENVAGDNTYINDPMINGDPDAALSVTQNWNPGGGEGTYNDHPVGVRYSEARERWAVYNEDRSAMTDGAAFNVAVSEAGEETKPAEGFPEYRDFYAEGDPETPAKLVSSDSSAGAIPAIKPFNFGRDPGGPEDKTLYLSVPKLGLEDVPVFDTVSEEKLRDGAVHVPATGYPWQKGANVFIAGHRLGYVNTPSYYVFFRLDELAEGDEILLEDSAGGRYLYRMTRQTVVGPDSVEVMNAVEGKSLITLQTCTLPDYKDRLIVQGELVEKDA